MGKIRVKTLGDEEAEKEQKNEAKKRQKSKKTAKGAHGADERSDGARLLDKRGTERVVAVGPSEEELEKIEVSQVSKVSQVPQGEEKKKTRDTRGTRGTSHTRSKSYKAIANLVDKNKSYSIKEALSILEKLKRAKFDETVELHINTTETGITGSITLPHGTGKQIRVAIADDSIIARAEKGQIDFDVLLAAPQMMPKLAKIARILGPKGLMPNPKNGTVTPNPQEAAKKFQGGLTNFKTEAKNPIIHAMVGKMSFGDKKLYENIEVFLGAVKVDRIKKAVLKSTMSPGIKIEVL